MEMLLEKVARKAIQTIQDDARNIRCISSTCEYYKRPDSCWLTVQYIRDGKCSNFKEKAKEEAAQ